MKLSAVSLFKATTMDGSSSCTSTSPGGGGLGALVVEEVVMAAVELLVVDGGAVVGGVVAGVAVRRPAAGEAPPSQPTTRIPTAKLAATAHPELQLPDRHPATHHVRPSGTLVVADPTTFRARRLTGLPKGKEGLSKPAILMTGTSMVADGRSDHHRGQQSPSSMTIC